jgi:hypothetical protein
VGEAAPDPAATNSRALFRDLHQPLHAIARCSPHHPNGDAGGTRFQLSPPSQPSASDGPNAQWSAENLHALWDAMGGSYINSIYIRAHYEDVRAPHGRSFVCENLTTAACVSEMLSAPTRVPLPEVQAHLYPHLREPLCWSQEGCNQACS